MIESREASCLFVSNVMDIISNASGSHLSGPRKEVSSMRLLYHTMTNAVPRLFYSNAQELVDNICRLKGLVN